MKYTKLVITLLFILGVSGCGQSNDSSNKNPDKIVLVQMPNENNPNAGTQHEAFRKALEEYIGIPVEETEGTDYSVGIEAMASKKVDIMLVSPMSYYQAKERANAELLVSTPSLKNYRTVFITKSDAKAIKTLQDLKGTTFAFVDQASSSGYLYPKAKLVKDLDLDTDKLESSGYFFDTVAFSGSHASSVTGVVMGDYEGAAVAEAVIDQMVEAKTLDKKDIKIIGETEIIPNPAYVIRGDLPEDLKEKIRTFFLEYSDSTYFKDIHGDPSVRFVKVKESAFKVVEEMIQTLHISNEE